MYDASDYRPNLDEVLPVGAITYLNGGTSAHVATAAVVDAVRRGQPVLIVDCEGDGHWEQVVVDGGRLVEFPRVRYYCDSTASIIQRRGDWARFDPSWETVAEALRQAADLEVRWGQAPLVVLDEVEAARGDVSPTQWLNLASARPGSATLLLVWCSEDEVRDRLKAVAGSILDPENHARTPAHARLRVGDEGLDA
jgi:hypothetical protein